MIRSAATFLLFQKRYRDRCWIIENYYLTLIILEYTTVMKIGLCSDHAGVEYKAKLISYLLGKGYDMAEVRKKAKEAAGDPSLVGGKDAWHE